MTWVLLAEDDDDLREALAAVLRAHGYRVQTAADGDQAVLELVGATELPAVVLLDLLMPHVNGREVLRAMRSLDCAKHVPVVVVTGLDLSDAERSVLDVAEVVPKPVAVQRLLAAIDRACRGAAVRRDPRRHA